VTDTRNITFGLDHTDRVRDSKTLNVQAGGEWRLFGSKIDFSANFSPSKGFETRTNLNPTVPGTGFRFDRAVTLGDPAGATFTQLSGPDVTDPANLVLSSLGFTKVRKRDRIAGGQFNLRRNFDTPVPAYLKTGFRFRSQDPGTISRPTTYNYIGPGGAELARFVDTSYDYQPHALRGTMPDVKFLDFAKVVGEWETKPEYFTINRVTTLRNELTGDRNASESVYAGYIMGHLQLGRLGALGGLRVEETHVEGTGTFQLVSPEERARRAAWVGTVTEAENLRRTQAEYGNGVTTKASYRDVFPSVHFRYEVLRGLLGRASYSSGIGRPNFGTIIPNNSVNDQTMVVTANNTSLRPQASDNFDATLEYYFEPAGLLSASVFLKEIKQYIFTNDSGVVPTGTDNGFNGDYAGYRLVTQANGGFARVRGIEVSYQQQFTHLPGFWRGFGIYANHTWLEAVGNYGSTVTTGRIPGFIPQTGNIGVSYIARGLSVRLQGNFRGDSIGNINANPALQQYDYSRKKIDINFSYQKTPSLTFFLDIRNIFGDTIGGHPYIYIPERPRGSDRDDPEIKIGVSGQFR